MGRWGGAVGKVGGISRVTQGIPEGVSSAFGTPGVRVGGRRLPRAKIGTESTERANLKRISVLGSFPAA